MRELVYFSVKSDSIETTQDQNLIDLLLNLLDQAKKLYPVGTRFYSLINSYKNNVILSHDVHPNLFLKNGNNWYINLLVENLSEECNSWTVIKYNVDNNQKSFAKLFKELEANENTLIGVYSLENELLTVHRTQEGAEERKRILEKEHGLCFYIDSVKILD